MVASIPGSGAVPHQAHHHPYLYGTANESAHYMTLWKIQQSAIALIHLLETVIAVTPAPGEDCSQHWVRFNLHTSQPWDSYYI